jgi:two-component system, OmpR family, response regulator
MPDVSNGNEMPELPPWHSGRHRLRVLIVEDNADAAESLAAVVRSDGHIAEVAYDGFAAVEIGLRSLPDVILLDLGLPGLDGWQLAANLLEAAEKSKTGKKPLLIAISGRGADDDRQRSAEVGILVHVVKPAKPEELLGFLRRFQSVVN